jgi:hypothetical protein
LNEGFAHETEKKTLKRETRINMSPTGLERYHIEGRNTIGRN